MLLSYAYEYIIFYGAILSYYFAFAITFIVFPLLFHEKPIT